MDDLASVLGFNIKILRNDVGLTQAEFGTVLGLSSVSIFKYEAGIAIPSAKQLVKMYENFGVSIHWLCGLPSEKMYKRKPRRRAGSK